MNRPAVLDHDLVERSPRRLMVAAAATTVCLLVVFAALAVLVARQWTPLLRADVYTDVAAHGLVLRHRAVLAVAKAFDFLADDPAMYVITGVAIAVFLF